MITLYRGQDRGRTRTDWLDSWHSFSFGSFYDENRMGVSHLRVINEDVVAPKMGFATHGHQDMEILTYVLDGELAHRDSLGNGSTIRAGEIQRMTAGTGIRHSEMNPCGYASVHFLQLWILPDCHGLQPSYEQKNLPAGIGADRFSLIAGPIGGSHAVTLHQDVNVWLSTPKGGGRVDVAIEPGRVGYLHIAKGRVRASERILEGGDGLAFKIGEVTQIETMEDAELLLFDMAN